MKSIRYVVSAALVAALAIVAAVHLGSTRAEAAPPAAVAPMKAGASAPTSFAGTPGPGTKARCSVSGEDFTVDAKTVMVTYNGRVYPFCCADCKPTFEKNPAKYAR